MSRHVLPVVLLLNLGWMGCSEELGPESFPTTLVRGTVRLRDRPLTGGFIALDPAEGSRGKVRVAPIRADGSFEVAGVAVGRVMIRFDQISVPSVNTSSGPIGARNFELMIRSSPIRRTIPAGRDASLPIDLIDEANRVIRNPRGSRRRRTRSEKPPRVLSSLTGSDNGRREPEPADSFPLVRVIYREGSGSIHLDWPFDEIERAIDDDQGTVWVDIQDLESASNIGVEKLLRDVFHFHTLAIEDALKDTHVPKIDDWNRYLYIVVDTLDFEPETDEIRLHELDIFLGKNYLVTYHNESIEVLERHRRHLEREPETRLQFGPSHLLYRLLDEVVAEFLPAIEHLDRGIDEAQDEVFHVPTPFTLRKIFHVKQNALKLHRVVIPMREVLNRLARDAYEQVGVDHRIYFRDVYDHLVRIHDIVESLRDLIAGALDTYLSVVSNRTNDIMKALTIVNVMFLPLTFVVGFFGMNFFGDTLMFVSPPLPKAVLFGIACAIMIGTPIAMTLMARRRGWF